MKYHRVLDGPKRNFVFCVMGIQGLQLPRSVVAMGVLSYLKVNALKYNKYLLFQRSYSHTYCKYINLGIIFPEAIIGNLFVYLWHKFYCVLIIVRFKYKLG